MTELPEDTLDRLMTGSCEASCPNSDYGHSNPDPNTTTTTTQIQTVQGTIRVQASGDFSSVSAAKKTELFGMLVAHAAGAGVSADIRVDVKCRVEGLGIDVAEHACHVCIDRVGNASRRHFFEQNLVLALV